MGLFKRDKDPDSVNINKDNRRNANEFMGVVKQLHKVSANGLSKEEKREKLRDAVEGLSEGAYYTNFPQIMEMIQRKKEYCIPFKDTNEQVDSIVEMIPRMDTDRELVTLYIRERRNKYNLGL